MCPLPPCENPVTTPGECCAHCPKECPHGTCKVGNQTVCYPVPCPFLPCENPVTTPGECCAHCPKDCPYPCIEGGQHFCYPPPCPPPLCNDSFTPPGACCEKCPKNCPSGKTCKAGNQTHCYPVPCPMPPCDNPVTTPGDCCPHCPIKCPAGTCKIRNLTVCYPVSCAMPLCKHPVLVPGDCCPSCPESDNLSNLLKLRDVSVDCPNPCTEGNHTYCGHIPCPFPPCVDAVTPAGECCPKCPTGPNCIIDGKIYPAFKDTLDNGKICRCSFTGKFGSGSCMDPNTAVG